jgi:hypothetical protein
MMRRTKPRCRFCIRITVTTHTAPSVPGSGMIGANVVNCAPVIEKLPTACPVVPDKSAWLSASMINVYIPGNTVPPIVWLLWLKFPLNVVV